MQAGLALHETGRIVYEDVIVNKISKRHTTHLDGGARREGKQAAIGTANNDNDSTDDVVNAE